MIDREKLKLHEGSRWEGESVVDTLGCKSSIQTKCSGNPYVATCNQDGEMEPPWVEDALAVIRAAGLDPELDAALAEVERLKTELVELKSRELSRNLKNMGMY